MRRPTPLPFVTVIALSLTAAACSKSAADSKPDVSTTATASTPPPASSASADASVTRDASADSGFALSPPSADGWAETKVSKAKLVVRIPTGATTPADRAGFDDKFVGAYFRVMMPSGYDVLFAERHGASKTTDITTERLAFKAKTKGKGVFLYDSEDAIVTLRDDGPPAGKYCEVTACGKLGGRPICASGAGSREDGTQIKNMTETECLAVVTIARSIRDL